MLRTSWKEDSTSSQCSDCRKKFSFTRRRHHCRSCGEIYCAECSHYKGSAMGYNEEVRLCKACYTDMQERRRRMVSSESAKQVVVPVAATSPTKPLTTKNDTNNNEEAQEAERKQKAAEIESLMEGELVYREMISDDEGKARQIITYMENEERQAETAEEQRRAAKEVKGDPTTHSIVRAVINLYKQDKWVMIAEDVESCRLEEAPVSWCDKKAMRITTEISCSANRFVAFMKNPTKMYEYDPSLEFMELLGTDEDGVSFLYTAHRAPVPIVPRDFVIANGQRQLTSYEVKELSLPFPCECVYVMGSVPDTKHKPVQKKYTRGTVHVYGYIVAERLDKPGVSQLTVVGSVDPCGSIPAWLLKVTNKQNCKTVALIRSFVQDDHEQYQAALRESIRKELSESSAEHQSEQNRQQRSTTSPPEKEPTTETHFEQQIESPPQPTPPSPPPISEPDKDDISKQKEEEPKPESEAAATTTIAPPSRPLAKPGEPTHEAIVRTVLDLATHKGWKMIQPDLEGCSLEDAVVEHCDKKAIRIVTQMKCSADTFLEYMSNLSNMSRYDPTLDTYEILAQYDSGVSVLYTAYKQAVAMIAPRDFVITNGNAVLSAAEIESLKIPFPCERCLVIGSVPDTKHKPVQKKYTRGTVHVYGYIVAERLDKPGVSQLTLVGSVDPGGKIPAWLIEAGNKQNCKKISVVRQLVEEAQKVTK